MKAKRGFTMVEAIIASGIGTAVLAGALTVFIWVWKQAMYAQHVSWSHQVALQSERNLVSYIRRATEIVAIDSYGCHWVGLRMPDDSISYIVHVNPIQQQRDGYMFIINSADFFTRQTIVAQGMTEIPASDGFSNGVFRQTGEKRLRIRYRVVEPVVSSPGAPCDDTLAAVVAVEVALRNAT